MSSNQITVFSNCWKVKAVKHCFFQIYFHFFHSFFSLSFEFLLKLKVSFQNNLVLKTIKQKHLVNSNKPFLLSSFFFIERIS